MFLRQGISDGEQRVRIDVALEHDISAKESKDVR